MGKNWLAESELALKAVTASAQIVVDALLGEGTVKVKESRRDVVTELDTIIEKNIMSILKSSGYHMVGEETSKSGINKMQYNELTWFIDPIDGTVNLVSSLPFYTISVGLVRKGQFLTGAVVLPDLKEIFFTFGNKGAYLNGKGLKVKSSRIEDSLLAASFSGAFDDLDKRKKEYELFGIFNDMSCGCLRLGSAAVNICYVAAGRLQGAYGISAKIWDVAGALAVASQAGCKIYTEWIGNTNRINYVVGAEGVAEKIAQSVVAKKLAQLKEIR